MISTDRDHLAAEEKKIKMTFCFVKPLQIIKEMNTDDQGCISISIYIFLFRASRVALALTPINAG